MAKYNKCKYCGNKTLTDTCYGCKVKRRDWKIIIDTVKKYDALHPKQ